MKNYRVSGHFHFRVIFSQPDYQFNAQSAFPARVNRTRNVFTFKIDTIAFLRGYSRWIADLMLIGLLCSGTVLSFCGCDWRSDRAQDHPDDTLRLTIKTIGPLYSRQIQALCSSSMLSTTGGSPHIRSLFAEELMNL